MDTGERSYSGTGRNQKTTRHVSLLSNYSALSASLAPVTSAGTSMKLAPKLMDLLGPYWTEFENSSAYQVVLGGVDLTPAVLTRAGDKPVGAIYRRKASSGTLLLLPDIDFYPKDFLKTKNGSQDWTPAATRFAGTFVSTVVALDKALRASSEVTPEPPWAKDPQFALGSELELRVQLLEAERAVEMAQKHKEATIESLAAAGALRSLLYEKGRPLELAIIQAL